MFGDLRDYPGFEDRATKRMCAELFGGTNTQQPADEPGIVEMQLGHLHEALAKIRVKDRKAESDKAGFKDAEPGFRRRLRDAAIPCERRVVEQLRCPTRTKCYETLKGREIAYVADRPHIALDVGCDVGTEPVRGFLSFVEYARVTTGEESLVESLGVPGKTDRLASRQRKEVVHCCPSCQRLADRFE